MPNGSVHAFLGGVIFNLSNILLVAAIDIAGLAVAFPVGVGLALVLGVITTYISKPAGNVPMLAAGVGAVMVAILLDAVAYKRLASGNRKTPAKGIVLSVVAGLLMGFFYSFVAQSIGEIDPSSKGLEAGQIESLHGDRLLFGRVTGFEFPLEHDHDGPAASGRTGAAAGRLLPQGQRPAARDRHPGRGDLERRHEFQHHCLDPAGSALAYGLGQGATMVGAFWGVFIWKEFHKAPRGTNPLLAAMFAFYLLGLGILIASKLLRQTSWQNNRSSSSAVPIPIWSSNSTVFHGRARRFWAASS